MNTGSAQSLAIFATATSVGLASVGQVAQGKTPPARLFVAGAVTAIILTGMAEFAPGIAGPLSGVILVTATFVYGGPAYKALSNIINPTSKPTTAPVVRDPNKPTSNTGAKNP